MPVDPIHVGQGIPSSAEVSRVQKLHHQEADARLGQMACAFQTQVKRTTEQVTSLNPSDKDQIDKDSSNREHPSKDSLRKRKGSRKVKCPGLGKYIDEVR